MAEAVDGRAKAMQLDIVDSKDRGCGMVVSKSFLDSTRRMVESWLGYGWSGCWMVGEMVV